MKSIRVVVAVVFSISVVVLSLAPNTHADTSRHAIPIFSGINDSPSRVLRPLKNRRMGETIEGKCSDLFVSPSGQHAGRAEVYADVPIGEEDNEKLGDVYFCKGTLEECSDFRSSPEWKKASKPEYGEFTKAPFSVEANEHITMLRVPPEEFDGQPPCFEEISINHFDQHGGTFNTFASGIDGRPNRFLAKVERNIAEQNRRVYQPQQQEEPQQDYVQNPNYNPYNPQNQNLDLQQQQNLMPQNLQTAPDLSTYQGIAQARANEMARQGVLSHAIGNAPGIPNVSEGIGMVGAHGVTPETCFFTGRLLADAMADGPNGVYRVRFWEGGQYIGSRI
jgi:hypothetical protein